MSQQADGRLLPLATIMLLLAALLVTALAGCTMAPSPTARGASGSATPSTISTTPQPTTPSPAPTPEEPRPAHITVTVWGPPQFAPGETSTASYVLQGQYEAFGSENEDLGATYVTKAPFGESGVLELLLAASYAAPTVLPDVAIVEASQLEPLVREGLLEPLEGLIAEELREGLFPFVHEAGTFDGELMAMQFEADIEHLIYYTEALEEPPATWGELFAETISYTFPAAGEAGRVNDSFLIQYMALGGELVDEEGKPALESSPLNRVLRLYDALRMWKVSPPRVLELSDLEDCWQAYTEGNVTVSHVSSWRYLTSRPVLQDTAFAPLPTELGIPATMTRGWAFVIVTESPYRREAAARLIEWLMTPQNLAQWSQASNHLPTRPSALRYTGWPASYIDFLESQLPNAFYRPSTPEFERIARALQVAVEDVLTAERTPRQASTQAIEDLQ